MDIVTTPMSKKILDIAGIKEYNVSVHPSEEDGDFAILLSESKVEMDSLKIKLNTFNQIIESIVEVSKFSDKPLSYDEALNSIEDYTFAYSWINNNEEIQKIKDSNSDIKVSVKSEFLKDIVEDMNFTIDNNSFDYLIYPDYIQVDDGDYSPVPIPTHNNVSKDPIERAELRYGILLNINFY